MTTTFTDMYRKSITITNTDTINSTTNNPTDKNDATETGENYSNDNFSATHTPLCCAFHEQLQTTPYIDYIQLKKPLISSCMEYKSKASCISARNSCIKTAYQKAESYLTPRNTSCVSNQQATQYSEIILNCFAPVIDSIKQFCHAKQLDALYEQLHNLIYNSRKELLQAFESELLGNGDFYKLYDINYFYDQAEIEEHDYRICDDSEPIFRFIETVFAKRIEYIFYPFDSIYEIEKDLNNYLYTFSNATYYEYTRYVEKIENIIQVIPVEHKNKGDNENFFNYVRRLCTVDVSP